jgi:hypothetical protein
MHLSLTHLTEVYFINDFQAYCLFFQQKQTNDVYMMHRCYTCDKCILSFPNSNKH